MTAKYSYLLGLSVHLWILYNHISPLQCHFQKFAGVAMKCTLHCHSILTTSLPLWSGIVVLICIFGTHSNATSVAHSVASQTPLPKYTPKPLRSSHCHSVITTPMSLRSAFVVYIMVCGNSTPHRYYKDTLVPLRQGKGIYDSVSENMTFHYATKTIFSKWQYLLFWRDQYNMYIVNDIRGSASNIYCYSPRDLISRWVYGFIWLWSIRLCSPGPCLNIMTVFPRYGDSLVKDKTVNDTVLSLIWESLYL